MPAPVSGRITQGFGPTDEPLDGAYGGYAHFNKGLDYGVAPGTKAASTVDGTVIAIGDQGDGWGISTKIRDAAGNVHNYGHLSSNAGLKVGQKVAAGDIAGITGNSGHSTGPHLSYDVMDKNGKFIDPAPFVGGKSVSSSPTSAAPALGGADSELQGYIESKIGKAPSMSDPKYSATRVDWTGGLPKLVHPNAQEAHDAYIEDVGTWIAQAKDLATTWKDMNPSKGIADPNAVTPSERQGRYDVTDTQNAFDNQVKILDQQVQAGKLDADVAAQKLQAWITSRTQADTEAGIKANAQDQVIKYGVAPGHEKDTSANWGAAFSTFAKLLGKDPNTNVERDFTGQTMTLDPEGDIQRFRAMNGAAGPAPDLPAPGYFSSLVSGGQQGYGWGPDSPPPPFDGGSGGGSTGDTSSLVSATPPGFVTTPPGGGLPFAGINEPPRPSLISPVQGPREPGAAPVGQTFGPAVDPATAAMILRSRMNRLTGAFR